MRTSYGVSKNRLGGLEIGQRTPVEDAGEHGLADQVRQGCDQGGEIVAEILHLLLPVSVSVTR